MVNLATFATFLKAIALKGGNHLLKNAGKSAIMAVREVLTNLLAGKLNLSLQQKTRLKKHAGAIRCAVKSCAECKRNALAVHHTMREIAPQLKSKIG